MCLFDKSNLVVNNCIIVLFISVMEQGTGPIKLLLLYIILKLFNGFHPISLLNTVEGAERSNMH